jgi:hypothetical protein
MSIGGNGDVERIAISGAELAEFANEVHHPLTQQWLPSGDSHFLNSQAYQNANHSQVICHGQICIQGAFISGAAIHTLIVAAICDGNAQVSNRAAEFVGKSHQNL